jgi:hypothetical protein
LERIIDFNPFIDNDGRGVECCLYCGKEHASCKSARRAGKTLHGLHEEDCVWMSAWTEVNNGK